MLPARLSVGWRWLGVPQLQLDVAHLYALAQHLYYAECLYILAYAVAHGLLHRLSVLIFVELLLLRGVQKRHEAARVYSPVLARLILEVARHAPVILLLRRLLRVHISLRDALRLALLYRGADKDFLYQGLKSLFLYV